jgi:hypothetical protein
MNNIFFDFLYKFYYIYLDNTFIYSENKLEYEYQVIKIF